MRQRKLQHDTERALHRVVRTLERDGIDLISYRNTKTGVQTVRNKVDVAVRRHIRTQIAQDGARMTMGRLDDAIGEAMKKRGGSLKDFAALTAGEQRSIFRKVIDRLDGTAKAKAGTHVYKLGGAPKGEAMGFDKANGMKANPNFRKSKGYDENYQSCVVAYEARRRGYDVETLPILGKPDSASYRLSMNTNLAWIDPTTGGHPGDTLNNLANTAKRLHSFLDEFIESECRYTLRFDWKKEGRLGISFISTEHERDYYEYMIHKAEINISTET